MEERKITKVHVQPQSSVFKCSNCFKLAELRCSRCGAVKYCNKDCQKGHWHAHKNFCQLIKKLKKQVEENADIVDNFPDMLFGIGKNNYFESDIGYFWEFGVTRCYCKSRKELALTLYKCGQLNDSRLAYELALEHMLDLIWLCRGDEAGVREYVPNIYSLLHRQQEAYDFLKFWNTFDPDFYDEIEHENPVIFPNLKGENLFEELSNLKLYPLTTRIEEVLSLFLIKFTAYIDVKKNEFVEARTSYETFLSVIFDSGNHTLKAVGNCSPVLNLIRKHVMENANRKVKNLKEHLFIIHALLNIINPFIVPCFWHCPSIFHLKIPSVCKYGSFEEARTMASQHFFDWFQVPGMLHHVKKLFFKLFGKQKACRLMKEVKSIIKDSC